MKTLFTAFSLILFFINYCSAQQVVWTRQNNATVVNNAIDLAGNSYIAGQYKDSARFEDTVIYTNAPLFVSPSWLFVAKYNAAGKLIRVIQTTGNAHGGMIKVATDNNDNLYFAGFYQDTLNFENTTLIGDHGIFSYFIAKYDSAGHEIWVKNFPSLFLNSIYTMRIHDFTIDPNNNVYLYGHCDNNTVIDGIPVVVTPPNPHELVLARVDPISSTVLWIKQIHGQYGYVLPLNIKADANNNVIVTGTFGFDFVSTYAVFNLTDTVFKNQSLGNSTFMARYSQNGTYDWAIGIDSSVGDYLTAPVIMPNQNIFLRYNNKLIKYSMQGQQLWINNNPKYEMDCITASGHNLYARLYWVDTLIYDTLTIIKPGYHQSFIKIDTANGGLIWHSTPHHNSEHNRYMTSSPKGLLAFSAQNQGGYFSLGADEYYNAGNAFSILALLYDTTFTPPANNTITGNIFNDLNTNCVNDIEPGLKGFALIAEPGPWFAVSDSNGNYRLKVNTGTYTVTPIQTQSHGYTDTLICPLANNYVVSAVNNNQIYPNYDFAHQYQSCHLMAMDALVDHIEFCNSSRNILLHIHNYGRDTAHSVMLKIKYPGEVISPLTSTPAWNSYSPVDSTMTFLIPDILPDSTFQINITDTIICTQIDYFHPYNYYLNLTPINTCYAGDTLHNTMHFFSQFVLPVTLNNNVETPVVIYPNPASNQLNMDGLRKVKNIEIYDVMAKKVLSAGNPSGVDKLRFNIESLSPGLYFIHLKQPGKTQSAKFLKH